MQLHLYWLDKNWKIKGCADNYHLVVNFLNKTYKLQVNPFCGHSHPEDIEVKRKSDIIDYIEYLKKKNFKMEEN